MLVKLAVVVLDVISHRVLQVESNYVTRHLRKRNVNIYFKHVLPMRCLDSNLTLSAWRQVSFHLADREENEGENAKSRH